nr:M20/M25/M40 family metallo-hydrolase [Ralstonia syzygii]
MPVAPGTEGDWTEPPFAGVVKDGMVWGRGAWDDKGNLIAQMEAAELLAASGFRPRRTIHFAFGADEEIGGEARRRADRRAAEITRRATGLRDRRGPADHRGRGAGAGQAGRADRRHREGLPVGGAEAVRDARPFVDAAGAGARARSP